MICFWHLCQFELFVLQEGTITGVDKKGCFVRCLLIGDTGSIFVTPFLERIATYYYNSIFDVISYRENRIDLGKNVSCKAIPMRNSLLNKIPKVRSIWALIQKQRYLAKAEPLLY